MNLIPKVGSICYYAICRFLLEATKKLGIKIQSLSAQLCYHISESTLLPPFLTTKQMPVQRAKVRVESAHYATAWTQNKNENFFHFFRTFLMTFYGKKESEAAALITQFVALSLKISLIYLTKISFFFLFSPLQVPPT